MTHCSSAWRKFVRVMLPMIPAVLVFTMASGSKPLHAAPRPQGALRMSCSSDDMRRHVCPVDTTGGVQMVHQKSEAKCIQNRSWGFDNRGIWVDHGCRAEFEVGAQAAAVIIRHDDGHEGGHDRGHDAYRETRHDADFQGWGDAYMVYCASDMMERVWCPADSRFGVRMIRQRSEAGCVEGETWGYGKRGIWVDRG